MTDLLLLANALFLGLRHGIDWDHMAAILDIVSTADTDKSANKLTKNSIICTLAYAIGHGLIVMILGVAAIYLCSSLPPWIDPIMERVVGITLLVLGAWVFYSLWLYIQGKKDSGLLVAGC